MEVNNSDAADILEAIADYLGVNRFYLERVLQEMAYKKEKGEI